MKKYLSKLSLFLLVGACAIMISGCKWSLLQEARLKSRTVNSRNEWIVFTPNTDGTKITIQDGKEAFGRKKQFEVNTTSAAVDVGSGALLINGTAIYAWISGTEIKYITVTGVGSFRSDPVISAIKTLSYSPPLAENLTFGSTSSDAMLLVAEGSDRTTALGSVFSFNSATNTFGPEVQLSGDPDLGPTALIAFKMTMTDSGQGVATFSYDAGNKLYYRFVQGSSETAQGSHTASGYTNLTLINTKAFSGVAYTAFADWDGTTGAGTNIVKPVTYGSLSTSGFTSLFTASDGTPTSADIAITDNIDTRGFYYNVVVPTTAGSNAVTFKAVSLDGQTTTQGTKGAPSDAAPVPSVLRDYATVDASNIIAFLFDGSVIGAGGSLSDSTFPLALLSAENGTNQQVLVTPSGTVIFSFLDPSGNLVVNTVQAGNGGSPLTNALRSFGNAKFSKGLSGR